MADSCGAAELANELVTELIGDKVFEFPEIDLDDPKYEIPDYNETVEVKSLTNEDLTTRTVGGSGSFDAIMAGTAAHLRKEYESNRISGAEYTKAYIELSAAALSGAVQFLLGKDQAYWQAILVQQQARIAEVEIVKARVELQTAKVALRAAQYQALTAEAEYALTKMKVSTEDATYCNLNAQTTQVKYNIENILPAQKDLLEEQIEVQRAQTMDTRSDGVTPIVGSVGKQKELYSQQITSYQRDAEVKAAKLFTDAWITQKTLDEGLTAPQGFTNASLDEILTALKVNNDIGT